MQKTYIIGHKNPDTDAVTSAISLSYLKNVLGQNTEPRVLGQVNKETEYVLKKFKIKTPKFLNDVKVQVKDVPYDRSIMLDEDTSIYEVYTYMISKGITGVPIIRGNKKFRGYVSLKEIATDLIRGDFDYLNASYNNILKVLKGTIVTRFDEDIKGDIFAAAYSSEAFISNINLNRNSIVIVGNRRKVIDYALSKKIKLLILVNNFTLNDEQLKLANQYKINVIRTPKETFEISKLIGLSNYIKTIVRNETPVVFNPKDYLTDFLEVSNKLKHTNYPIIDKNNTCKGMMRLLDVNTYNKKQVILVDHNDPKQSVDGLNEATILEIIDHHALGNLTTNIPISFRNMSVGSTNTILYRLYKESNVDIPPQIAGIMLSGILSDTLILKSPTTTKLDKEAVTYLSNIAGLDYKKYGMEMIKAGSSLEGMSVDDILYYDYKEFDTNGMGYGIGQILTLDYEDVLKKKDEFIKKMDEDTKTKGFKLMTLFVTDVVNAGSYVLFSSNARNIIALAFDNDNLEEGTYLPGVISRKKQIVPVIMNELENMD